VKEKKQVRLAKEILKFDVDRKNFGKVRIRGDKFHLLLSETEKGKK